MFAYYIPYYTERKVKKHFFGVVGISNVLGSIKLRNLSFFLKLFKVKNKFEKIRQ